MYVFVRVCVFVLHFQACQVHHSIELYEMQCDFFDQKQENTKHIQSKRTKGKVTFCDSKQMWRLTKVRNTLRKAEFPYRSKIERNVTKIKTNRRKNFKYFFTMIRFKR